jgi:hypothetical protein
MTIGRFRAGYKYWDMIGDDNHIATSDIVLASTLKVSGYELDSIERVGYKGSFHFNNVDPQFLQDFDLGTIRVEPGAFNNALRHLTASVKRILAPY